jgi:energy-dependent translational throttle protein EttA
MPEYIYQTHDLRKRYSEKEVLKGITLAFFYGAKIGVIGNNGAGKSSLMRIMAGEDKDFEGYARLADGSTVGYVSQEPTLNPDLDVWGNVQEAVSEKRALLAEYDALNEKLGEPMDDDEMQKVLDRQAHLTEVIEKDNLWELDRHLERAMHALGLPPKDADVKKLSGGEKRRVGLCKTLLRRPDLLLLDEPTNHLDADSVDWLEQHLKEYSGTVILITHDRYFLDNVVGWMLEIEFGKATPFEGNYSSYLEQKGKRMDIAKRQEAARAKVLARELEWIRQTPRARQAKSKSRIKNYERLLAEQEAVDTHEDAIDLLLPPGPKLGDRVVSMQGVTKGFGGRTLIKDLTFDLPPGGIIGVIGPNGTGKTTLMKMIIGEVKPDAGTITVGKSTVPCYVDQGRESLDDAKTVFEEISGGHDEIPFGPKMVSSRAYVGRFRFTGSDQQRKVGELSGGQRNRVQLAKLLRKGGNLLMLDEPTNDLDLQTLRVLEEALQGFAGCAVVVSHDRYFLNRVATHIISFEGDGVVHFFEGDYDTYHDWKKRQREEKGLGEESKAGRYRKL